MWSRWSSYLEQAGPVKDVLLCAGTVIFALGLAAMIMRLVPFPSVDDPWWLMLGMPVGVLVYFAPAIFQRCFQR